MQPKENLRELEKILQADSTGKKSHSRESERARINVTNAITTALEEINKACSFLSLNKSTIRTGDYLSYESFPNDPPEWMLFPGDLTS